MRDGDELRRPEIEVVLRPERLPSYVALITLRGEHDLGTAEEFRVSLASLFGNVLVDLDDCDFIDSSVIAVIIRKAQELEREGHRLELVVSPAKTTIARVLEIVQIHELVTVHERMPGTEPNTRPASGGGSH